MSVQLTKHQKLSFSPPPPSRRFNLPNARDLSLFHPYSVGPTYQTTHHPPLHHHFYDPALHIRTLPHTCTHTTLLLTSSQRNSQCYRFASLLYGLSSSTPPQTELRELDYYHPSYCSLRLAAKKYLPTITLYPHRCSGRRPVTPKMN